LKNKKMVIVPDDLNKYNYSKDNFPIAKAVAMSCSLPVVFVPYKLQDNVFIDGGVTNNFPINLFKDYKYPTVGFKLNEIVEKPSILEKYKNKIFNIKNEVVFSDHNI